MPFSHFDSNAVVTGLFLYISLKPTNAAFQKLVQTKEPRFPFQFSLSVACFHCLLEPLSSETMCLECFVFPSGLLYHFLIGWNFFHLRMQNGPYGSGKHREHCIAINQNQQIITRGMRLASFRKLHFRRQNS